MLIGFNNDVDYRGKEFHIQTEDHGRGMAKIESQIFHEGQILDTEIVSYDSVLDDGMDKAKEKAKLKSLLEATHKGLYQRLVSGEYDEMVGLEPLEEKSEVAGTAPEEFEPSQDRVPDAAMEVEEEGEEAFEQFHENEAQKHVDLDDLKSHLAEQDGEGESEPDSSAPEPDIEPEIPSDEESLTPAGAERNGGEKRAEAVQEDNESGYVESRPPPQVSAQSSPPPESSSGSISRTSATPQSRGDTGAVDNKPPLAELPETGVASWNGCEEPTGELSIVSLVESFLLE